MTMTFLVQRLMLAQAQAAAAADGAQSPAQGGIGAFVQMFGLPIMLFVIIYFLMIRPTSKQRKQHLELLNALKKDDDVVTQGGIVGKVVSVDDKIVTVEIADKVKIKVLRDRIAGRFAETATKK